MRRAQSTARIGADRIAMLSEAVSGIATAGSVRIALRGTAKRCRALQRQEGQARHSRATTSGAEHCGAPARPDCNAMLSGGAASTALQWQESNGVDRQGGSMASPSMATPGIAADGNGRTAMNWRRQNRNDGRRNEMAGGAMARPVGSAGLASHGDGSKRQWQEWRG